MRFIQFVHFITSGWLLVSRVTAAWFEAVLPFSLVMSYRVPFLDGQDGGGLCFPCKIMSRKEDTVGRKG